MVNRSSSSHDYFQVASLAPLLIHLSLAVSLLAFHVHAESNGTATNDGSMDFSERFQSGSFSRLDLILMVALGIVGMEVVNFLSYSLGGMFPKSRNSVV